jgi:hypothetical protein
MAPTLPDLPPELVDGEEEYSVEKILDSGISAEDGDFNIW